MELPPISQTQIDRRLQEIDRQIHSALRDIRRNLEELEVASRKPGPARGTGTGAAGPGFSEVLRDALEDAGDTA